MQKLDGDETVYDDTCSTDVGKWDYMEDLSLWCGVFLIVGIIFVMRNVSILAGVYLPFSGNHNMVYMHIEPWRYVFCLLSFLATGTYVWKLKKKTGSKLKKAFPYVRLFLIGILIIVFGEVIFWRLAYGLQ